MRLALIVAGVIVAAAGVGVLLGKFSYKSNDEVLKLGEFSAKVEREHPVPQWAGLAGLALGGGLLVVGLTRKS